MTTDRRATGLRRVVAPLRHRLGVAFHRRVREIAAAEHARHAASPTPLPPTSATPPVTMDDIWRIAKAQSEMSLAEAAAAPPKDFAVFGPSERLHIGAETVINDALFNTVSGDIRVEATAFFGHGVAVLTGSHDPHATGLARQRAIPEGGNDIVIGPGAWIGSRATIIGPAVIGAHAVVAANAVVTSDVDAGAIVAGVPARTIGSIVVPPGPPTLDVPTDVGRMFVHVDDEFITPCLVENGRMLDDDLGLVRERRPGATVVDVGSNIGYSTLALSAAVGDAGTVVAFEPHPDNLALLDANVRRNGAQNVRIVGAAAMAHQGDAILAEAAENTGDHRMSNVDDPAGPTVETDGEERRAVNVRTTTIDDELRGLDRVELMLLDTQGTEHHAIAGASATIARFRPLMFVEFWPQGIRSYGDDPIEVLAGYDALGYDRRVVEDEHLDAIEDRGELVRAVHGRPGASGGFVTLELRPRDPA